MPGSKRNSLAGAKATGRAKSNLASGRDYIYDKKYQAKPAMVKYRMELNAKNAELKAKGKAKVGDGKDIAHKKSRKSGGTLKNGYTQMAQSKNRAKK